MNMPKDKNEIEPNLVAGRGSQFGLVDIEEGVRLASSRSDINKKRLPNKHSSGMEKSVLRFQNVNFHVGSGANEKKILTNVSSSVTSGHVLAIMGPSGAGKTTLINVLTLEGFSGVPSGNVTLNSIPMTDTIFKEYCFVVKQQDKHWPYLSTRETLTYAARLYEVAEKEDIPSVVNEILQKMGLDSAADTKCLRLSGGQRRRLSIAIALLKQPTLLFLDEPTSGLDAAAATHIMTEITRVAQEEKLIILCTIHQPSTKVYNGFDQVMVLSQGREAYTGDVGDAEGYFKDIGYALPPAMNPAEHFLDLVNSDFLEESEVLRLLDTWEGKRPEALNLIDGSKGFNSVESKGVTVVSSRSIFGEIPVMFCRQYSLIIRDPILYLGRCGIFFVANIVFAFVYWNAREYSQDQANNKMWVNVWFIGVPTNMGVVAVYALNDEFKSILRESKNGMVRPMSYVLAKSIMIVPIMFIFAFVALGINAFVVQYFPGESFGTVIILYAVCMYVFENAAEALSVWFEDPIMGMLNFLQLWFASFLFGGFLIPVRDMYWPFELCYYIMPYQYYIRSVIYAHFVDASWDECDDPESSAVCVGDGEPVSGYEVLDGLGIIYPLISSEKQVAKDIGSMLIIAFCYKLLYIVGVVVKSKKSAKIRPEESKADDA